MSEIGWLHVPYPGQPLMTKTIRLGLISAAFLLIVLFYAASPRLARAQSADDIVRKVVHNELDADFNDHTSWMYRDTYKSPDKDIVKLVIETSQGNLSENIEDGGRPPTPEQHQADLDK